MTTPDARAQRMQFPSMIPADTPYYSGYGEATPGATLNGTIQPPPTQWDPYATQAPSIGTNYAAPPNGAPIYNAPPYGTSPYAAPTTSPYAAPAYGAPAYGAPYDPAYAQPGYAAPPGMLAAPQRLLDNVRFQHTWLAGDNGGDLDINTTELSAGFAFPFFQNPSPIMVTPGFNFHFLDGPASTGPGSPDLPAQLYDAYLDTSWQPVLTSWLSADLAVRVGVYSDFEEVNSDSLRITGRGLGVVTLSDRWQVAAGVVYLDRMKVKLLPAGGLIWTPNQDVRWEILFPRPKLAQRLTTWGNADIWGYLAAEYGGGEWTLERDNGMGDRANYNDIRVMAGLEWYTMAGNKGWFEVGYVFDREIIYESITPDAAPDDTFMLRAGLNF